MNVRFPPQMLNIKKKKIDVGFILLCVVCLIFLFFLCVDLWFYKHFFLVSINGGSMLNTLHNEDLVYAERNVTAKHGDIIIINVEKYKEKDDLDGDLIIKRLIAMEGDVVQCVDGVVSVKYSGTNIFVPLDEDYAKGITPDFVALNIEKDEIFFLGDNRAYSKDSGELGCYKITDIMGVVPEWSVEYKSLIKKWENFRNIFRVN